MVLNVDDSPISAEEFRIRRFAINLQQPVIMTALGVSRASIDRWGLGGSNVPRKAREMLDMAEDDIDAVVAELTERRPDVLPAAMDPDWPWGEATWHVVVARARYDLAQMGHVARIGDAPRMPFKGRWAHRDNVVPTDFKASPKARKPLDKAV